MLFGPESRCGEKRSCRLSFLSTFSHKVDFFQVEQIPDAYADAI